MNFELSSPGAPSIPQYDDHTVKPFLPGGAHGHESAFQTFTYWQVFKYASFALAVAVFFVWDYKIAFAVVSFILALLYMAIIGYKLLTVMMSVLYRSELRVSEEEIAALKDEDLPVYTILVPMYKEPEVASKIVDAVNRLDYPRDKLDVKLLLEENDPDTVRVCREADLPDCIEVMVVPHSLPKTKPKACNHGLEKARGEYLVIYDAEDRPESDQLKKAIVAFKRQEKEREKNPNAPEVTCLQGKLNYYNPRQNYLTKWFTLEYTAWFDLFLPGLHKLGVPIPLGGTSNHFKTETLQQLGGWDPFNVTEDCDLGMRLHRAGYRTLVLDSTTWEEANSRLGNWIRQRSRWIKGYMQTHLVHTREWMRGPPNAPAEKRSLVRMLREWRYGLFATLAMFLVVGLGLDLMAWNSRPQLSLDWTWAAVQAVGATAAILLVWGWIKGSRRLGVGGYPSFLATVGGLSFTMLLNPIFWAMLGLYLLGYVFLLFGGELRFDLFRELFREEFRSPWQLWYEQMSVDWRGPVNIYAAVLQGDWEGLQLLDPWSFWSQVFVPVAVALFLANFVFIFINFVAIWRRELDKTIGREIYLFALLVPIYWVLISIAAWKGALQLRPGKAHYWEKTQHGLDSTGAQPLGIGDDD